MLPSWCIKRDTGSTVPVSSICFHTRHMWSRWPFLIKWVSRAPKHSAPRLMQLHPWLASAQEQASESHAERASWTKDYPVMHEVKAGIHDAGDQPANKHASADQPSHEASDA